VEPFLTELLRSLERALALPADKLLAAWRGRDALLGREITWSAGRGTAAGIDGEGRLVVELPDGGRTALDAGEVHLGPD
jgi:BirA family biotin operon repressor/biotin-[acetyl-CoA-carboxylase] ligase